MSEHAPRIRRDPESPDFAAGEQVREAIRRFAAAAVRADGIDPIITELVRLRCAQVHDCRLCGSLRLESAREHGFDEAMTAKIGRYETSDLGPAAIAALRLTDAMILAPASAGEELAEELHRHFTDSQIAEICFDVVKWSQQKQLVALRIEAPLGPDPVVLAFDENGNPVWRRPSDDGDAAPMPSSAGLGIAAR